MTRPTPSGGGARIAGRRSRRTLLALAVTIAAACASNEDAVPPALRARLKNEARLGDQELEEVRQAVGKRIAGRTVRVTEGSDRRTLDESQRAMLFEILSLPAGVFDEGIRRDGAATFRVLNGPARSDNTEVETFQRLWVDVDSLLPRRYELVYAFPGYGQDRRYEITVEP